ncbi:MAG: sulfite exporter TauE/SafE family protein [Myxococcota bacterium]|nr:sulfite exporter TauE/SafE family protein [Myxococcota bacterium]
MKRSVLTATFRNVSIHSHWSRFRRELAGTRLEVRQSMIAATLALSILIGVSLGLLGGGGSILTVPILSYVAGMDARDAIAASLFVVGVTSAAGLATHAREGRVMWRTGLLFGVAGMVGACGTGLVAAYIPAHVLMIALGVTMVAAAVAMMRPERETTNPPSRGIALGKALGEGLLIGAVTGLIGVGGGFLIVPALVLFGRIPMERAVATSLLVIAMNSIAGFTGHFGHANIDWPLTLGVTGIAIVGSNIGGRLAGRIAPTLLRRVFGVLVVLVAAVVLLQEIVF